jgi:hypothetical protein
MFLDTVHGPEIGTSYIDWVKPSRFYLKTETESRLRNVVFWNINRKMDNVQKHNVCINVPWSQMFRSYCTQFSLENIEKGDLFMQLGG